MSSETFLIPPGGGAETRGFPSLRHKVGADRLQSGLAILEGDMPPGHFVPPHTHTLEDEVSYVIRGTVTFRVGEQTLTAPAGSYVVKPRGIVHAIWNSTSEPALIIELHSPGGFAEYYDAFGDLPEGPERMQAAAALQQRFGLTMDFALAARVAQENGLRLPGPPAPR